MDDPMRKEKLKSEGVRDTRQKYCAIVCHSVQPSFSNSSQMLWT